MARETVEPSQELADAHTLSAQRYAGYFVGHPYRNVQQSTTVTVDRQRPWREPVVVADDCIFCVRLTDEEAVDRVLGFQFAVDKESVGTKWMHFRMWVTGGSPDVPEPHIPNGSRRNLRKFCELFADMPTEKRPNGWKLRPLPFCTLPLRLQRKLCVEWNHIYLAWMQENDLQYDFEKHEFWREVPDPEPGEEVGTAEVIDPRDPRVGLPYYSGGWF